MQINAEEFDRRTRSVFKPIHPIIAGRILEHTGITRGACLDLDCGGGYLGMELAWQSDLQLVLLDLSEEMLAIAGATWPSGGACIGTGPFWPRRRASPGRKRA